MNADKPFSPETNLRDALVEAFKADEGYLNQRVGVDQELNFDLMVDIALRVIKDWTVPGPPVEGFTPDAESIRMRKSLDELKAACPVRDVYGNIIS